MIFRLLATTQELADESPAARPLRRRAALLLGAWAPKMAQADRPAAYRALLSLMVRHIGWGKCWWGAAQGCSLLCTLCT